jgi:hypothetical protein
MCEIIVINEGEYEIATPKEFRRFFGVYPYIHDSVPVYEDTVDCCLCDFDIKATFQELEVPYDREWREGFGDYYVETD